MSLILKLGGEVGSRGNVQQGIAAVSWGWCDRTVHSARGMICAGFAVNGSSFLDTTQSQYFRRRDSATGAFSLYSWLIMKRVQML